jgi:hypothetical protein
MVMCMSNSTSESQDEDSVVDGVKQRALFGWYHWYGHLCAANGPSAKAMGKHGPLDQAAPDGKAGAARDRPMEACLIKRRSLGHGPDEPSTCEVCSNSLFPKRKLLEDSFDEREGKSYT